VSNIIEIVSVTPAVVELGNEVTLKILVRDRRRFHGGDFSLAGSAFAEERKPLHIKGKDGTNRKKETSFRTGPGANVFAAYVGAETFSYELKPDRVTSGVELLTLTPIKDCARGTRFTIGLQVTGAAIEFAGTAWHPDVILLRPGMSFKAGTVSQVQIEASSYSVAHATLCALVTSEAIASDVEVFSSQGNKHSVATVRWAHAASAEQTVTVTPKNGWRSGARMTCGVFVYDRLSVELIPTSPQRVFLRNQKLGLKIRLPFLPTGQEFRARVSCSRFREARVVAIPRSVDLQSITLDVECDLVSLGEQSAVSVVVETKNFAGRWVAAECPDSNPGHIEVSVRDRIRVALKKTSPEADLRLGDSVSVQFESSDGALEGGDFKLACAAFDAATTVAWGSPGVASAVFEMTLENTGAGQPITVVLPPGYTDVTPTPVLVTVVPHRAEIAATPTQPNLPLTVGEKAEWGFTLDGPPRRDTAVVVTCDHFALNAQGRREIEVNFPAGTFSVTKTLAFVERDTPLTAEVDVEVVIASGPAAVPGARDRASLTLHPLFAVGFASEWITPPPDRATHRLEGDTVTLTVALAGPAPRGRGAEVRVESTAFDPVRGTIPGAAREQTFTVTLLRPLDTAQTVTVTAGDFGCSTASNNTRELWVDAAPRVNFAALDAVTPAGPVNLGGGAVSVTLAIELDADAPQQVELRVDSLLAAGVAAESRLVVIPKGKRKPDVAFKLPITKGYREAGGGARAVPITLARLDHSHCILGSRTEVSLQAIDDRATSVGFAKKSVERRVPLDPPAQLVAGDFVLVTADLAVPADTGGAEVEVTCPAMMEADGHRSKTFTFPEGTTRQSVRLAFDPTMIPRDAAHPEKMHTVTLTLRAVRGCTLGDRRTLEVKVHPLPTAWFAARFIAPVGGTAKMPYDEGEDVVVTVMLSHGAGEAIPAGLELRSSALPAPVPVYFAPKSHSAAIPLKLSQASADPHEITLAPIPGRTPGVDACWVRDTKPVDHTHALVVVTTPAVTFGAAPAPAAAGLTARVAGAAGSASRYVSSGFSALGEGVGPHDQGTRVTLHVELDSDAQRDATFRLQSTAFPGKVQVFTIKKGARRPESPIQVKLTKGFLDEAGAPLLQKIRLRPIHGCKAGAVLTTDVIVRGTVITDPTQPMQPCPLKGEPPNEFLDLCNTHGISLVQYRGKNAAQTDRGQPGGVFAFGSAAGDSTGVVIQMIAGSPSEDAANSDAEEHHHLTFLRLGLPTTDHYCNSQFITDSGEEFDHPRVELWRYVEDVKDSTLAFGLVGKVMQVLGIGSDVWEPQLALGLVDKIKKKLGKPNDSDPAKVRAKANREDGAPVLAIPIVIDLTLTEKALDKGSETVLDGVGSAALARVSASLAEAIPASKVWAALQTHRGLIEPSRFKLTVETCGVPIDVEAPAKRFTVPLEVFPSDEYCLQLMVKPIPDFSVGNDGGYLDSDGADKPVPPQPFLDLGDEEDEEPEEIEVASAGDIADTLSPDSYLNAASTPMSGALAPTGDSLVRPARVTEISTVNRTFYGGAAAAAEKATEAKGWSAGFFPPFSLHITRNGQSLLKKKDEALTGREEMASEYVVAGGNLASQRAEEEVTQRLGENLGKKAGTLVVSAVTTVKDSAARKLADLVDSFNKVLGAAHEIIAILNGIQDLVPSFGFSFKLKMKFLEGTLSYRFGYKEFESPEVFLWKRLDLAMTLFSIGMELRFGVGASLLFIKFEAMVFLEFAAELGLELSREIIGPKLGWHTKAPWVSVTTAARAGVRVILVHEKLIRVEGAVTGGYRWSFRIAPLDIFAIECKRQCLGIDAILSITMPGYQASPRKRLLEASPERLSILFPAAAQKSLYVLRVRLEQLWSEVIAKYEPLEKAMGEWHSLALELVGLIEPVDGAWIIARGTSDYEAEVRAHRAASAGQPATPPPTPERLGWPYTEAPGTQYGPNTDLAAVGASCQSGSETRPWRDQWTLCIQGLCNIDQKLRKRDGFAPTTYGARFAKHLRGDATGAGLPDFIDREVKPAILRCLTSLNSLRRLNADLDALEDADDGTGTVPTVATSLSAFLLRVEAEERTMARSVETAVKSVLIGNNGDFVRVFKKKLPLSQQRLRLRLETVKYYLGKLRETIAESRADVELARGERKRKMTKYTTAMDAAVAAARAEYDETCAAAEAKYAEASRKARSGPSFTLTLVQLDPEVVIAAAREKADRKRAAAAATRDQKIIAAHRICNEKKAALARKVIGANWRLPLDDRGEISLTSINPLVT
jgi:hypothetical protein